MRGRIGFDQYTIMHREFTPEAVLQFAAVHQFDGVQFVEVATMAPGLDAGTLGHIRRMAEEMGLYVEAGISSPNPVRRSRELERPVSVQEMADEIGPQLDALQILGCRHARAYIGDRHDRFRLDVPWPKQVAASIEVIDALTPRLKANGLRIALETHADLTAAEMVDVLGRLDPDVAGITLDTGNLAMRLDDPLAAAERLAPFVVATHVKDMVLAFTTRGLCWQARPVGSGILPIPDILAALVREAPDPDFSIELHPRIYDLPIFDPRWLAFFPDLRPESLAAVVRLASDCERRYTEGTLERPEAVEAIPWIDRDLDWLARSLGYLRSVIPALVSSAATIAANPRKPGVSPS